MAARVQALATVLMDTYGGDTQRLWTQARSGADLVAGIAALPGFGDQKTTIFAALLGKHSCGPADRLVRGDGGLRRCGSFRSIADVMDEESRSKVRADKQQQKAAAKAWS